MVKIESSNAWLIDGNLNAAAWLKAIEANYPTEAIQIFSKAINLNLNFGEHLSYIGTSCLHQGLFMADILEKLNMDAETITAAIIYSSVRYADLHLDEVRSHLGNTVVKLIQNVIKMDDITELSGHSTFYNFQHPKIDNLRKMFLAMVNDVRAVFIKLAEHLYLLRNIKHADSTLKTKLGKETMEIYAPLANRLGLGHVKWEMEDLAFRYLHPEKYQQISTALNQKRVDRDQYVQNMIKIIRGLLTEANLESLQITGRSKHIYSIYRKMQRKDVDFSRIYDIAALRIIVPTVIDCYKILGTIHTTWQHVPAEFDDYIAVPKKNGYQSIHTVIVGPDNKFVEIQIRTQKMHEDAELGIAAHWIYKEGNKGTTYEAKITWLRQVMDWQKEIAFTEEKLNTIQDIFNDRVYVFTPNGDIIDLPQGSTPIDFAYHVHTNIGHCCKGAVVNGKIVSLIYQLKTGEHIEILTGNIARPSRDWLNPNLGYVKTSKARAKIQQWFRHQDEIASHKQEVMIESNKLPINPTALALKKTIKAGSIADKPTKIKINGVGESLTHIANCCQPKTGDKIIGYITKTRGISIHRTDCFNILRITDERKDRLIDVDWD